MWDRDGRVSFHHWDGGLPRKYDRPIIQGTNFDLHLALLGNYGIHQGLSESSGIHPRGVVCRELMLKPDHRDSIGSVHDFLHTHQVPGICDIDTRSLTRKVREHGTMLAIFGPIEEEQTMLSTLQSMSPPDKEDLVAEVTISQSVIINPGATTTDGLPLTRLAVLDCGIKYNILRELCKRFEVVWCPANMPFNDIITRWNPQHFSLQMGLVTLPTTAQQEMPKKA